jgi:hypothetical protein
MQSRGAVLLRLFLALVLAAGPVFSAFAASRMMATEHVPASARSAQALADDRPCHQQQLPDKAGCADMQQCGACCASCTFPPQMELVDLQRPLQFAARLRFQWRADTYNSIPPVTFLRPPRIPV